MTQRQSIILSYLGSEHPDFELEGSARSVVEFEDVLPDAALCVAYAPIDLDRQVGIIVVDLPPEVYELVPLALHLAHDRKNLYPTYYLRLSGIVKSDGVCYGTSRKVCINKTSVLAIINRGHCQFITCSDENAGRIKNKPRAQKVVTHCQFPRDVSNIVG